MASCERNCPLIAIDAVIFNEHDELLLIQRGKDPFQGSFAFPGGHMNQGETTEECCVRELFEETGIKINPNSLRLVGVYSDPQRDPRQHCVGIAYLGFVSGQKPVAADDAQSATFVQNYTQLAMAFDHKKILADAIEIKNYACPS